MVPRAYYLPGLFSKQDAILQKVGAQCAILQDACMSCKQCHPVICGGTFCQSSGRKEQLQEAQSPTSEGTDANKWYSQKGKYSR